MITARRGLIGLAILILSQAGVEGGPIQIDLSGYVDSKTIANSVTFIPDPPPRTTIASSITLSDPSQPLTFDVSTTLLEPSVGPNGYYGGATINSDFSLSVSVETLGSVPSTGASVTVAGQATGRFWVGTWLVGDMDGSVSGTGTRATLSLPPGTNPADVPPYLADLLAHPSRVSYGGQVTDSIMNRLTTSLTIAPPLDPGATLSVPEPSTLAVVLAGLWLARRRRSPRACSTRVASESVRAAQPPHPERSRRPIAWRSTPAAQGSRGQQRKERRSSGAAGSLAPLRWSWSWVMAMSAWLLSPPRSP